MDRKFTCWHLQSPYEALLLTHSNYIKTRTMVILSSKNHSPMVILYKVPYISLDFDPVTLPYCHAMMNHNRGRGWCLVRGRDCGHPSITFNEGSVATIVNYGIYYSIRREALSMEEEETRRGHLMISDIQNLLSPQLKQRGQEKLRPCD